MKPLAIEFKNVTKELGSIKALNKLSFKVEQGTCHGFLGPNGAGKSTTIKLLANLLKPDSGEIEVFGKAPSEFVFHFATRLGLLPEKAPLYPHFQVDSFLGFIAEIKGLKKKEIGKAVDKVLELLKIGELRRRLIGNLSRGNKQKVALAQVFLTDPDLIVLDEPTVGLDPQSIVDLRTLLKKANSKATIFLSSHQLSEVEALCDQMSFINNGEILFSGKTEDLMDKIGKKERLEIKTVEAFEVGFVKNFLEKYPLEEISRTHNLWVLEGKLDDRDKAKLMGEITQRPETVTSVYWHPPQLEEAYLKILNL
ncbi:MAG: ABC transporter ATP-binding protein [Halobacteriovoraceae bacterium]|nr:ABC transporter ATP-binding protein [Halobacteriovoraceae bacterium]MCB9095125.1 ABC transporter ATP-binding protein [Halobacteriovoraceae bacterium]